MSEQHEATIVRKFNEYKERLAALDMELSCEGCNFKITSAVSRPTVLRDLASVLNFICGASMKYDPRIH